MVARSLPLPGMPFVYSARSAATGGRMSPGGVARVPLGIAAAPASPSAGGGVAGASTGTAASIGGGGGRLIVEPGLIGASSLLGFDFSQPVPSASVAITDTT